ncbi:MAG: PKD domain-containing protein, partial [Anaerolineales bacterium]|nr:PKD domain-containing protein [Anaerolineales bacterium]
LYIPELAIGRLVETPSEISTAINHFLEPSSGTVSNALVTGYTFLKDQSLAIVEEISDAGVSVTQLIYDGWPAILLEPLLLTDTNELISLNGHFNHYIFLAGDEDTYLTQAQVDDASTSFAHDLIFTVGCQSGLNLPASQVLPGAESKDFAQVFVQKGAAYIANTGFGYGDMDSISYSELLALKFVQQFGSQPLAVGKALMQAKQQFYASVGYTSFGDYDEKAMLEWTLYGFPMMEITLPTLPPAENIYFTSTLQTSSSGYSITLLTVTPPLTSPELVTRTINGEPVVIGNFYQIDHEAQINPGRPIQPRMGIDLDATAVISDHTVTGILFLGGTYVDEPAFNPVISKIVSDTLSDKNYFEPPFIPKSWYPDMMHVLNRLHLGELISEKLVLIPAQYKATTEITGTERIYTSLDYEINHVPPGNTNDFAAPLIYRVEIMPTPNGIHFDILVKDDRVVEKVIVTYDEGFGMWQHIALSLNSDGHWVGNLAANLQQAIVQAVDTSGNVATSHNKGDFYIPVGVSLTPETPTSQWVQTGQAAAYVSTIENLGAGEDTFLIQLQTLSTPPWFVTQSASQVTLAATASSAITITVLPPAEAFWGIANMVKLTVTSLSNPNIFDTTIFTTTAARTGDVKITPIVASNIGTPGHPLPYTLTLKNTGNYTDTFNLFTTGNIIPLGQPVTLGFLQSADFTLSVEIPENVISGTVLVDQVWAVSVFDPNKIFTATLSTSVRDETITNPHITTDSPTALGHATTFTVTVETGSNITYTWNFGDGHPIVHTSMKVISHTYPSTGVFTAVVTSTNLINHVTTSTQVTVAHKPEGLLVMNDSPTPLGEPTTFTATVITGTGITFIWDFGTLKVPNLSITTTASYTYLALGTYTATVTALNSVGSASASTQVTIVDEAISGLSVRNDSPTAPNEDTTFTVTIATGTNVSYAWNFGDTIEIFQSEITTTTHTYLETGIFTAVVTASNSVSSISVSTVVTVTSVQLQEFNIYLPTLLKSSPGSKNKNHHIDLILHELREKTLPKLQFKYWENQFMSSEIPIFHNLGLISRSTTNSIRTRNFPPHKLAPANAASNCAKSTSQA